MFRMDHRKLRYRALSNGVLRADLRFGFLRLSTIKNVLTCSDLTTGS